MTSYPLKRRDNLLSAKKIPVLEVDELWSFAFRSKDKVWVWIAMNRETREIVASACGDRTENTCRILWDRVPSAYKEAIVLHLKECEFRFHHREEDLSDRILALLKEKPL